MEFTRLITSPPDRERLVAEIWADDRQFAELSQEGEVAWLEIYQAPRGQAWKLKLSSLTDILEQARSRLQDR